MNSIFTLFAILTVGDPQIIMGQYTTMSSCQAAAAAYANAHCKVVSTSATAYGTCWACMHGCTAEENIELCGSDPKPIR